MLYLSIIGGDNMSTQSLFQSFTNFINTMYGFTEDIKKDLKPSTVTPLQNEILLCLYANHTKCVSGISDSLNLNLPNTSRELKKLTELDLIEKGDDPNDKRKSIIILSQKGKNLMNTSFSAVEEEFNEKFSSLPKEEIKELEDAIRLIEEKLLIKLL